MYDIYLLSIEFSALLLVSHEYCNTIHVTIRAKYKKLNYNKARLQNLTKTLRLRYKKNEKIH